MLPWTLEQRSEVEVAYLLAKTYWGQGLGTEASVNMARTIGMTLERETEDEQGPILLYSMSTRPKVGP